MNVLKPLKLTRIVYFIILLILLAGVGVAQDTLPIPHNPDETPDEIAEVYNGFYFNVPEKANATTMFTALNIRGQLQTTGSYSIKFKHVVTGKVSTFPLPENTISWYVNNGMGFNLGDPYILTQLQNRTAYMTWLVFKDTTNKVTYTTAKHKVKVYKALPVTLTSPTNNSIGFHWQFFWAKETPNTAQSYRINIYDAVTNTLVFTKVFDAANCCYATVYANTLTFGKTYKWQVITNGYDGVTAKSKMWTFMYIDE